MVGALAGQTNQTLLELNKRGLELLGSGNYNESLGYFDGALPISQDNAQVLLVKGYTIGNLCICRT